MSLPFIDLRLGPCIERLRELPDQCIQTCVTSPPYFGLRCASVFSAARVFCTWRAGFRLR